jgi:hypothetical protein
MSVRIEAVGLRDKAKQFQFMPEIATKAAQIALNETAQKKGMKLLRTAVESEINFPQGYVNSERLFVKRRAYNDNLEVVLAARQRATSLARFVQGPIDLKNRTGGVSVRVKGRVARIGKAFPIKLRAGSAAIRDKANIGIALRLKEGEQVRNKRIMSGVQLDHTLYLLYGPSVDQVFRDVADEQTGQFLDLVEREFDRQFVRLTRGSNT